MPRPLVIVESPAKARTIAGFLGRDFAVESSIGHIRDLPSSAGEIPPAYKGEPWARDGVDVDNDFKPLYVVPREKRDQVKKLKALLKDASELYLATDEDREGESISWHLREVLAPQVPVRRMVFHEITRSAIQRAIEQWRDLDLALVDAQETRRILDRLYGYRLSEVLWKKSNGRSAGRVQSVATRMVVERERARMRFRSASYWDIEGTFAKAADEFGATLSALDGRRLATGKDFSEVGEPASADLVVLGEDDARALTDRLTGADFAVRSVEEKPYRRRPAPPFITSTLQQEAGRKLGFGAQRAMRAAQSLYENGFISYMRTDSTTLSDEALQAIRREVEARYGNEYLAGEPRRYASKVKNAQEAHEAIRPAGEVFRHPDEVAGQVGGDEGRLYDLIWKRTIASQMTDAVGHTVSVRLGATSSTGEDAEFATSGTVITFAGFQRVYVEGADDPEADTGSGARLPRLEPGDALDVRALAPAGHATQPPARYTEASLVKALEEAGVGRPSTYASILGRIQDVGYVRKKGSALIPTWTAFAVVQLLERHFDAMVDYGFTARMEDDLDRIAAGEAERVPWLSEFYFGNGNPGLKRLVSEHLDEIDPVDVNTVPLGDGIDGRPVAVRVGKYGPYLQRGDERASIPEDLAPDELTIARAEELLAAPSGDRELGVDADTGLPVYVRAGRYGPYVQLGAADNASKSKPKTASLFKTMSPETLGVDDALRLLTLPRVVGVDPDGHEVVAANGRFGPYLKRGSDTRSLDAEADLFTVTLEDALVRFAQPKAGRGQRSSAAFRELGTDPTTDQPVVIKDGRYGAYITDGEVNVTLPRGETVEGISLERAVNLLAEKRAKGPAKPRRTAKVAKKAKKTAKKATKVAKKTTKKPAKKRAAS